MSWHRIDEQREISADFITCAEYQLFLDEKRAQGEHRQPDHWDGCQFLKGCAQKPILGVRGEDANQFCEWLGQRPGNKFGYRLPTLEEASSYPGIAGEDIGCWCVVGEKQFVFVHAFNLAQWKKWQELFFSAFIRDWDRVSRDFDPILDPVFDLVIVRALARTLNCARTFTRARVFDCARAFTHVFTCARDFASDPNLSHVFALANAVTYDPALSHTLNHAVNCAIGLAQAIRFAPDRTGDHTRNLEHVLDCAINLGFPLDLDLDLDLDFARDLAPANFSVLRIVCCISILFSMARDKSSNIMLAWFKRFWLILNEIDFNHDIEQRRDAALNLHTFFCLIDERCKGNLPAWEGIRIVRERLE